jgi:hypothetical protein
MFFPSNISFSRLIGIEPPLLMALNARWLPEEQVSCVNPRQPAESSDLPSEFPELFEDHG